MSARLSASPQTRTDRPRRGEAGYDTQFNAEPMTRLVLPLMAPHPTMPLTGLPDHGAICSVKLARHRLHAGR